MEFCFECRCGEEISDFTRGVAAEISTQVECDECGSSYALTTGPIVDKRPSLAIVQAVAAISNTPIEELDPIGYAIDTEARDALLTGEEGPRISFVYDDFRIQVDSTEVMIAMSCKK